jgi:hypothetical protein
MTSLLAGEEADRMGERLTYDLESVSTAARRAREVDDESLPPDSGNATGEEPVRGSGDSVGSDGLGDTRHLALDHRGGRLGRDVAGRNTRPARRHHELELVRQLLDRLRNLPSVVGNHAALDLLPAVAAQQLFQSLAALVRALAPRNAVRDGEYSGPQSSSLLFSRSRTSRTTIESSTAFAMS